MDFSNFDFGFVFMSGQKSTLPAETVNAKALGEIFEIDERWVQQLVKEEVFEKKAHGEYVLAGAGRRYADWFAKSEVKRKKTPPAKERVDLARARKYELEVAQIENELVPVDLATAIMDFTLGVLQTELSGLPGMASNDVAVRRKVEDGTEAVLGAIKRRFSQACKALEEGDDPYDTDETDDM